MSALCRIRSVNCRWFVMRCDRPPSRPFDLRLTPIRWRNSAALVANQHFWQGQPNLWKQLLTARTTIRMAEDHKPFFERFGYACDPDSNLTDQDADANWYALEFASLKEECRLARSQVLKVEEEFRASDIVRLRSEVAELRAALSRLPAEGEGAGWCKWALSRLVGKLRRGTGRLIKKFQETLRLGGRAVESRDHNE